MSGTGYRTRLPYNPGIGIQAPLLGSPLTATGLDDDFTGEAAQYAVEGVLQSGFVELGSRWQRYDPDETIDFAAVDVRLQMAYLATVNDKSWGGFYQALPQPTAAQPVREHWVMTRCLLASANMSSFTGLCFGLLCSDDLATDPFNANVRCVGQLAMRGSGEDFPQLQSFCVAATHLGNNGPAILEGAAVEGVAAVANFFRLRIRQERVAGESVTYNAYAVAEVGCHGVDWWPIAEYTVEGSAAPWCKHVGFGARASGGAPCNIYCDLFRVAECPIDEYVTLGSVPRIS